MKPVVSCIAIACFYQIWSALAILQAVFFVNDIGEYNNSDDDPAIAIPNESPTENNKRLLSFVHIPKTAGSTIEMVGMRQERQKQGGGSSQSSPIKWGYDEYCDGMSHSECAKQCPPSGVSAPTTKNNISNTTDDADAPSLLPCSPGCLGWHDPERLKAILNAKKNTTESTASLTTFCVIRHPVHRMLSSYRYNGGNGLRKKDACLPKQLNVWANRTIRKLSNKNPNWGVCHFRKQSEFPCDIKLLFDDLEEQFDDLMIEYGMSNVTFRDPRQSRQLVKNKKTKNTSTTNTTASTHERKSSSCPNLTVRDFDVATEQLIKSYYADDMELYYQVFASSSSKKRRK